MIWICAIYLIQEISCVDFDDVVDKGDLKYEKNEVYNSKNKDAFLVAA